MAINTVAVKKTPARQRQIKENGKLSLSRETEIKHSISNRIKKGSKGRLIWRNFSFTTLKFLFRKKSIIIFQGAKCISKNIIQFVHKIEFHSYNHDNVSFIERIKPF